MAYPKQLKSFIQRLRGTRGVYEVNQVVRWITTFQIEEIVQFEVDGHDIGQIEKEEIDLRITISKAEKKNLVELKLQFHNQEDKLVETARLFSKHLLLHLDYSISFKKKRDAYDFVTKLVAYINEEEETYKSALHSCTNKDRWAPILDHYLENETTYFYDRNRKRLSQFENKFILTVFKLFREKFGELVYRYSSYSEEDQSINYEVSASSIFEGITDVHNSLLPYGTKIFYDRKELARWNSRIRFERRSHTTKWFDLELNISKEDLEIIKKANLETGVALTSEGLILLDQSQKRPSSFYEEIYSV